MRTLAALLCLTVAIAINAACGDGGDTNKQDTPGANNGGIITTPGPR